MAQPSQWLMLSKHVILFSIFVFVFQEMCNSGCLNHPYNKTAVSFIIFQSNQMRVHTHGAVDSSTSLTSGLTCQWRTPCESLVSCCGLLLCCRRSITPSDLVSFLKHKWSMKHLVWPQAGMKSLHLMPDWRKLAESGRERAGTLSSIIVSIN